MDDWLFERVDLGGHYGQDYEGGDPWKVELHMTQGDSIAGAEGAFAPYPPHISSQFDGRVIHQYVPLSKASYADLGGRADRSHTIQIEIVGMSENAPNFWPEELDWIGTDVLAPIKRAGVDFALTMAPQAFHGADEGIKPYLATASSPIRFRDADAMRAFSGILGHQHEPPPDDHWDPGKLDVGRILTACAWSLGQNPVLPMPVPVSPLAPGQAPTPQWYSRQLMWHAPNHDRKAMLYGLDIARVQQILIEQGHGYATKVDGWFGKDTDYSTRSFQRERGLTDDGIIGPLTASALGQ